MSKRQLRPKGHGGKPNKRRRTNSVSSTSIPPPVIATKSNRTAPSFNETFANLLPDVHASINDETQFETVLKKYQTMQESTNEKERKEAQEFIDYGTKSRNGKPWNNDEYDVMLSALKHITDDKDPKKCKFGIWKTVQVLMKTDRTPSAIRVRFTELQDATSKISYRHSEFVKAQQKLQKYKGKMASDTR